GRRAGQPRVQPGLAHRARPPQPARRLARDHALRARTQGESRRPVPRRLSGEGRGVRPRQRRDPQGAGRRHGGLPTPGARADPRAGGHRRGDEVMARATFRIWRGDANGGQMVDYPTEISEGMVVLDAVHRIQAEAANDLAVRWNCKAGKCGSCSAEINGNPRLMCMTRLSDLPLEEPVTIEPMRTFPHVRDLVTDVSWNYEVKKRIKKYKPTKPEADGSWRMQQDDIDRVQE